MPRAHADATAALVGRGVTLCYRTAGDAADPIVLLIPGHGVSKSIYIDHIDAIVDAILKTQLLHMQ